MKRVVIAIGGNAIIRNGQRGTTEEQLSNIQTCCNQIADLAQSGYQVILTHGNGPQVGNIVIQNDMAKPVIPESPLDICDAATQGSLGYLLARTLSNALKERNLTTKVATILTQVIVDPDDPAFSHPSKFIGPFLTKEEAMEIEKTQGFLMKEDSDRGYRRVVPSPYPQKLVELEAIQDLASLGYTLIIAGGGGIPVINETGRLTGIEAVIDKDFTSSLVAENLKADAFVILTEVSKAAIHYNQPDMQWLDQMNVEDCKKYLAQGEFPDGSMKPKVQAALNFVEHTKKEAVITSLSCLIPALQGTDGTHIHP